MHFISFTFVFYYRNPNAAPSGVTDEEWPKYQVDTQEYLVLDETLVDGDGTKGSEVKPLQCAYWREYIDKLVTQTGIFDFMGISFGKSRT